LNAIGDGYSADNPIPESVGAFLDGDKGLKQKGLEKWQTTFQPFGCVYQMALLFHSVTKTIKYRS